MQKKLPKDLGLLIELLLRDLGFSVGQLIMGLIHLIPGIGIFIGALINDDAQFMFAGGFLAFIGLLIIVAQFEAVWYQVESRYEAALFEKHGVPVDSALTQKEWVANDPRLHLDFNFSLYGVEYSCPIATTHSNLFEKYSEGDTVPLIVLHQNPALISLASFRSSGRCKAL